MSSSFVKGKTDHLGDFFGDNDERRSQGLILFKIATYPPKDATIITDLQNNKFQLENIAKNIGVYHRKNKNSASFKISMKSLKTKYPTDIISNYIKEDGTVDNSSFMAILNAIGNNIYFGDKYYNAYTTNNIQYQNVTLDFNLSKMYHKITQNQAGLLDDMTLRDVANADVADDPFAQPNIDNLYDGANQFVVQNGKYGKTVGQNNDFQEWDYKRMGTYSPIGEKECFGTNLKFGTGSECRDAIEQCLINGDVSQCFEKIKNANAVGKIEKLHPVNAMQFLELFGFQVGNQNGKVMNVTTWLNKFAKNKLTANQIKHLRDNNILDFFKHLVAYVNYHNIGNTIQNVGKNYAPAGANNVGSDDLDKLKLKKYVKPDTNNSAYDATILSRNMPFNALYTSNQFGSYKNFGTVFGMVGGGENNFRDGSIMPFTNGSIGSITQEGGNRYVIRAPAQGLNRFNGAKLVENIINGQIASLRAKNKSLDNDSKRKITDWISKLKTYEEKLLKYIQILQKANQVYLNDNNRESVNIDKLENIVANYKHLQQKHLNIYQVITDIYAQIAKLNASDNNNNNQYSDPMFRPIEI